MILMRCLVVRHFLQLTRLSYLEHQAQNQALKVKKDYLKDAMRVISAELEAVRCEGLKTLSKKNVAVQCPVY